jgi:hypothetical protein
MWFTGTALELPCVLIEVKDPPMYIRLPSCAIANTAPLFTSGVFVAGTALTMFGWLTAENPDAGVATPVTPDTSRPSTTGNDQRVLNMVNLYRHRGFVLLIVAGTIRRWPTISAAVQGVRRCRSFGRPNRAKSLRRNGDRGFARRVEW